MLAATSPHPSLTLFLHRAAATAWGRGPSREGRLRGVHSGHYMWNMKGEE